MDDHQDEHLDNLLASIDVAHESFTILRSRMETETVTREDINNLLMLVVGAVNKIRLHIGDV